MKKTTKTQSIRWTKRTGRGPHTASGRFCAATVSAAAGGGFRFQVLDEGGGYDIRGRATTLAAAKERAERAIHRGDALIAAELAAEGVEVA